MIQYRVTTAGDYREVREHVEMINFDIQMGETEQPPLALELLKEGLVEQFLVPMEPPEKVQIP